MKVGLGRIARLPCAAGRILIPSIFIFLLLIVSLPLVSQTPPQRANQVDAKNQRQGEWIIFFDAKSARGCLLSPDHIQK